MWRILGLTLGFFGFVLFAACAVMYARSYHVTDRAGWVGNGREWRVGSRNGYVAVSHFTHVGATRSDGLYGVWGRRSRNRVTNLSEHERTERNCGIVHTRFFDLGVYEFGPPTFAPPEFHGSRVVMIPYWWLLLASAPFALLFARSRLRFFVRVSRRRRGLCPSCGYDLRESRGACPECGWRTATV